MSKQAVQWWAGGATRAGVAARVDTPADALVLYELCWAHKSEKDWQVVNRSLISRRQPIHRNTVNPCLERLERAGLIARNGSLVQLVLECDDCTEPALGDGEMCTVYGQSGCTVSGHPSAHSTDTQVHGLRAPMKRKGKEAAPERATEALATVQPLSQREQKTPETDQVSNWETARFIAERGFRWKHPETGDWCDAADFPFYD